MPSQDWVPDGPPVFPLAAGKRMESIPAFPLNGSVEITPPIIQGLIDREIGLYNKITRRNHLLYGAATYTPVVASSMDDDRFDSIVSSGLGSWIKVDKGETVSCLATPTDALKDMDRAITMTIEEMARMGIRMLSPEGGGDSGVALEIRNSAQTAQLGLLNTKVSQVMSQVIAFMFFWRYGADYEVRFSLSQDFSPTPLGADWLRLVTEWYTGGLIPRSVFLEIAKQNDVLPSSYNDEDGVMEIQSDPLVNLTPTKINID